MTLAQIKNKIIETLKAIQLLRLIREKDDENFIRNLTEFSLNYDVDSEVETQKRFLRENPNSAKPYYNLGLLYYFQGKAEAAIDSYKQALKIDQRLADAHKNLGEIYAVREQYDLAWNHAKAAEKLGNTKLIEMLKRYLKEPVT
jgi:tetratricopeptide (TPR) repeat protein